MGDTVVFGDRTRDYIQDFLDLPSMQSLLSSLQRPFPHLRFSRWTQSNPPRRKEFGDITMSKRDTSRLRVRIRLNEGKGVACHVETLAGIPMPRLDREAIRSFADFVGTLVESLTTVSRLAETRRRKSDILPVHIDIGSLAVGRYVGEIAKLRFDPTPTLLHLRGLSQQTYENTKLAYGLIVTRRKGGLASFPMDIRRNRSYLAVSDGLRTALQLDRDGRVLGLVSLQEMARETGPQIYRPGRFRALAKASARQSLGVGLSEHGDIVCVHRGNMIVSLRQGQWQVWNHLENVAVIRREIQELKPGNKRAHGLAKHLYRAALDLSFQRRGGLFVVLREAADLGALVEQDQLPTYEKRQLSDRGLDFSIRSPDITRVGVDVIGDLAALDGATVVNVNGKPLAYGAILKVSPQATLSHRGARFQASKEASRVGVAVMVSSDGNIEVLAGGKRRLTL